MKLVTFTTGAEDEAANRRLGILEDGDGVIDVAACSPAIAGDAPDCFRDMLALLDAGPAGYNLLRRIVEARPDNRPDGATLALNDVRLLAPLPRPRSIRDCMVFQRHLEGCGQAVLRAKSRPLAMLDRWITRLRGSSMTVPRVWFERPVYYKGNPASVVGPESNVRWPSYTERLDFELELAIVIGRQGRDICAADAEDYIAGYTIFNDFSARDVQIEEMRGRLGPAKGKDFDTGNALGPALITPDEIPDAMNLTMTARVNGDLWCTANTRDMRFSIAEIIAYISRAETLYPGDVIGTGTAPGGCGWEHDRWLQPGDCVELEIEGLGVLRNRIVRDQK